MQIRFPRRLQLGLRPWYGLTLRQLLYVVVAGVTGGACILFIQTDFLIRVLIGLIPIAIGLGLAFFRKDGMSVEQWIITWLKFAVHPQKRVWSRGDATDRHTQVADMQMDAPPSDAPPAAAPVRTAQRDAAPVQRVRLCFAHIDPIADTESIYTVIPPAWYPFWTTDPRDSQVVR